MDDDLVKRLRDHCFSTDWQVAVADSREAADRIEELEAALRIIIAILEGKQDDSVRDL